MDETHSNLILHKTIDQAVPDQLENFHPATSISNFFSLLSVMQICFLISTSWTSTYLLPFVVSTISNWLT